MKDKLVKQIRWLLDRSDDMTRREFFQKVMNEEDFEVDY